MISYQFHFIPRFHKVFVQTKETESKIIHLGWKWLQRNDSRRLHQPGYLERVSTDAGRVLKRGEKESPVRSRLKIYIDSFFNGSWKEVETKVAIEIRSHCAVAIRGCSLAQAVSFRSFGRKGHRENILLRPFSRRNDRALTTEFTLLSLFLQFDLIQGMISSLYEDGTRVWKYILRCKKINNILKKSM